ncbi:MAG: tRNA 2-selenouridine(34) synthase MnmH [Spirochaetes bacterium]|jgi:tRNA 2-selenouridine synthase|nr:tRNA 2-selenouridine(34) synthase MnmH [Spirochaetota bacterium]
MAEKIEIARFMEMAKTIPIVDVRSPGEYEAGHIPGAVNIPLFDNDQRAEVGTIYKQTGREPAIMRALEIVGPKLTWYVNETKKHAVNGEVLVHCWRGGMRSSSFAWFCETVDISVSLLDGGYKAYRRYIRESFLLAQNLIVVGGFTGSGKTEILGELQKMGEQVIDLEKKANHKGSAFGAIGQKEQPTTEQFENDIAIEWLTFDMQRPVFVEDESLKIGTVVINENLFSLMRDVPLFVIQIPREERICRIERDYCVVPAEVLVEIVKRIERRLGGDRCHECCGLFLSGDYYNAISILLDYYDKGYAHGMSKRNQDKMTVVEVPTGDPAEAARALLRSVYAAKQPFHA